MATTCATGNSGANDRGNVGNDTSETVDDREATQLLPLEGSTSEVWKHFGFPAKNGKHIEPDKRKRTKVCCKLCKKMIKYCGNTSNLRAHLERDHKKEFQALLKAEAEKEKQKTSCSIGNSKQPTVVETLNGLTPIARNSNRWIQLTKSVCYFIGKDMQPYDTVNDQGFLKMLNTFEPRYSPPDRKAIASNYMPKLYETERKRVLGLVKSNDDCHYAITTDLWTSRANQAYCCVTIHYITSDYMLRSHLLETKEFSDSHSAENVAEELISILENWELSTEMLVAATTDNCANMVRAVQRNGWLHVPCFSHVLNLAVEKVLQLPDVSKAVARCRRVVSHFHHSSKSTYLLKIKQQDLHHPTHSLIGDVVTRWNSTFYMVERLIEQQQPLCAALLALKKGDLMPSDTEFAVMESYIEIMKPLVTITEAIGAQKWVTISTVHPLLHKLLNVTLIEKDGDTSQQKAIKSAMRMNLQNRYAGAVELLLSKAAF